VHYTVSYNIENVYWGLSGQCSLHCCNRSGRHRVSTEEFFWACVAIVVFIWYLMRNKSIYKNYFETNICINPLRMSTILCFWLEPSTHVRNVKVMSGKNTKLEECSEDFSSRKFVVLLHYITLYICT